MIIVCEFEAKGRQEFYTQNLQPHNVFNNDLLMTCLRKQSSVFGNRTWDEMFFELGIGNFV